MGRKLSLPKISAITFLVSQAFFSLPVFAAGYQINEISTSLQGAALAGAAAANNDVSSMFINPATLSTLIQNQIYFGGSEIMPHVRVYDASAIHTVNIPGVVPSSITAPVLGSTSQSSISKSVFVPDGYFGWRINNRFVVGLALVAPFGLTTKYDNNSVLRFAADNSFVEAIDINPAVSYAINDKWALGAGFIAQYMQAAFSNFNGPYTGIPAIDALVAANYATYVKGHSWGYGYNLGAMFNPNPCTRFGVGFRSQITERLHGFGRQYVSPGGIVPAPSPNFLFNAGSSDHATTNTPAVLTFSGARDIGKWTVKASAQVNFWNTFQQLSIYMPQGFATNSTIQAHWQNSFFGSAGTDFRVTEMWTVRGGLAYDQTPTQNTYRDPRIPDSDRVWLALGATGNFGKYVSLDGAYTHIFMMNQTVNVTQASGSNGLNPGPLQVNQVYAKYKGSADIVALALRIKI
ncbi:MAG: OmpP1/FadL family transporter [Gammaproteobacteria bacterium]